MKRPVMIFLALLICGPVAAGHDSGPNCHYNVSVSNYVGTVQKDPQSDLHKVTVVNNQGGSPPPDCKNFRLYFGTGQANSYNRKVFSGSTHIPYNLYKESGLNSVLKDVGAGDENSYLSGTLEGNSATVNFYVKVPDMDFVFYQGPGYFNDLINISAHSVSRSGGLVYQSSGYMNVQLIIPRFAELSLGPVGSAHNPSAINHTMDLGALSSGKTGRAILNVKGNVPFGVYMSSYNGGKLRNGDSEIGYEIAVGDAPHKTLYGQGSRHYITQHNSSTALSGLGFPIEVRVGQVPSNPKNGEYSDVVTVTVDAW